MIELSHKDTVLFVALGRHALGRGLDAEHTEAIMVFLAYYDPGSPEYKSAQAARGKSSSERFMDQLKRFYADGIPDKADGRQ